MFIILPHCPHFCVYISILTPMYETIDEETNEVILEYQPKENEKIIRFVAISPKEKFPITVDNVKDKYGIISYKTNKLLEN